MAFRPGLRPLTPTPGASGTLGLGCAPIGNLYTAVAEADAVATVERALDRGIRFVDTAPHYGAGASEQRLGRALAGVPRDSVAIATKVGRRIVDADGRDVAVGTVGTDTVGDLSRDGVLRSVAIAWWVSRAIWRAATMFSNSRASCGWSSAWASR